MTQLELAKFNVDISGEIPTLLLGNVEIDIEDVDENNIFAYCEQHSLNTACLDDFPSRLRLRVHSQDGFGTFLFHEVSIYREDAHLLAEYICHQPNKYWNGTWGLATYLEAIKNQLSFFDEITLVDIELDNDYKPIRFR